MTQWIKNMFMVPLNYGFPKINIVITKIISNIFNIYGKRLFNIDNDKLIERNESVNDRNYFYMYPIKLKEIEQDFGLNSIKIISGKINNLVVSVPWKAMMAESTILSIKDIDIIASISKNENSIYFTSVDSTNSYLFDNNFKTYENKDLIDTFYEIRKIVQDYVNNVEVTIDKIKITIINSFDIVVNQVSFKKNKLSIDNVIIKCYNNEKIIARLSNLVYCTNSNTITINSINIEYDLFLAMPLLYTDNSESNINLKILVNNIQIDKLALCSIDVNIDNNNITINKILTAQVKNLWTLNLFDNFDKEILQYNTNTNIVRINQSANVKIADMNRSIDWIYEISDIIKQLSAKIIIINPETLMINPIIIKNTSLNIICTSKDTDVLEFTIDEIVVDEQIELRDLYVKYNDTVLTVNKITTDLSLDKKNINFHTVGISIDSSITQSELINLHINDNNVDVYFNNSSTANVSQLVQFINDTVSLLSSDAAEISDNTTNILLHFVNAKILIGNNTNAHIIIKNAQLNMFNKSAVLIEINAYICDYLVLTLKTKYLSIDNISIDKILIYIDPMLFDILKNLIGTLNYENDVKNNVNNNANNNIKISEEGLKQLADSLVSSMQFANNYYPMNQSNTFDTIPIIEPNYQPINQQITQSTAYFGYYDNQIYYPIINSYPQIKMLTEYTTIDMNCSYIGVNINGNESTTPKPVIKFSIKKCRIYLFDKLEKTPNIDHAFICCIINDCIIDKYIETFKNEYEEPFVRIIESKPNTRSNIINIYKLKISNLFIIDTQTLDPVWKYFLIFNRKSIIDATVNQHDDTIKVDVNMCPFTLNVREEILIKLLLFLTNNHSCNEADDVDIVNNVNVVKVVNVVNNNLESTQSYIYIESFNFSGVGIKLNFYPLIIKNLGIDYNILTLSDIIVNLSEIKLQHINTIDKLIKIIIQQLYKDINPDNFLQFIPNIKLLKPYMLPTIDFIKLTKKYLSCKNNSNVHTITCNISRGTNIVNLLVKQGIEHLIDLFS